MRLAADRACCGVRSGLFWLGVMLCTGGDAQAQNALSGHLKYQATGEWLERDSIFRSDSAAEHAHDLDARLNLQTTYRGTQLVAQTELLTAASSASGAANRSFLAPDQDSGFSSALDDDLRAVDASLLLGNSPHSETRLRIDRLYAARSFGPAAARIGRQALSWGNGLVFSVLDFLNPFAPLAIDKEYKTGSDMAFLEVPWGEGTSLQMVAVGRSDPLTKQLDGDSGSFATKLKTPLFGGDIELVAGRHYDESLFGAGVSKSVLGAVVRADLVAFEIAGQSWNSNFLLNCDRSFTLFEKNWYVFAEYFHSSLGSDDYSNLTQASDSGQQTEMGAGDRNSSPLADRIFRGELFTIGRDYPAPGVRLEINPLLNYYTTAIFNLHDQSAVVQQRLVLDLFEDTQILLGVTAPIGPRGSEFGGVIIESESANAAETETARPPVSAYLRISFYF